jgi:hypothetical protein
MIVKRILVLLTAVTCLCCSATLISAQMAPDIVGFLEQVADRGQPLPIGAEDIEGEALAPVVVNSLNSKIGWMERRNGGVFEFATGGQGLLGLTGTLNRQHFSGLWFERSWETAIGNQWIWNVTGSYLIPFQNESRQTYNNNTRQRTWNAKSQWWNLDTWIGFKPYGPVMLVGGFRYDDFHTNFTDSRDIIGINATSQDDADTTLRTYIPYGGVTLRKISATSGVIAGVKGCPYLPGSIEHKETFGGAGQRLHWSGDFSSGYFLEAYTEWITTLRGAQIGVFGKFLRMYARGDAKLTVEQAAVAVQSTHDFDLSYQRSAWIIGAAFQLTFGTRL